ncbi:hypothetical protein FACS1894168_1480 [Deltaproteobacteria bacterium]|nr:hypothetical protein FACS1894168_1480 [Deltaproteobacteria bacterium]
MQISLWLLIALTLFELVLFFLLMRFFQRLRKSEGMLLKLQTGQASLLANLEQNARLEKDLISSFVERQAELRNLDRQLEERANELSRLLNQAEAVSRSPQFLRELILNGVRQGKNPLELARNTGLSPDEVKLILSQSGQ